MFLRHWKRFYSLSICQVLLAQFWDYNENPLALTVGHLYFISIQLGQSDFIGPIWTQLDFIIIFVWRFETTLVMNWHLIDRLTWIRFKDYISIVSIFHGQVLDISRNIELLLTHESTIVFWCWHSHCGVSGVLPLAAGTEGEALWLRPTGSGTQLFSLLLDPLQTSVKPGLATAPLKSAFMCPLMKKPPAQQLAIKHRQIETPKYE